MAKLVEMTVQCTLLRNIDPNYGLKVIAKLRDPLDMCSKDMTRFTALVDRNNGRVMTIFRYKPLSHFAHLLKNGPLGRAVKLITQVNFIWPQCLEIVINTLN